MSQALKTAKSQKVISEENQDELISKDTLFRTRNHRRILDALSKISDNPLPTEFNTELMKAWYWKLLGFGTFLCFLGMYLGTTCLSIGSSLMLVLGLPPLVLERRQLFNHPLFKPFCALVVAVAASMVFAEPFPFFKPFFKLRYFLCVFVSGIVFTRFPLTQKTILKTVLYLPIILTPMAVLQRLDLNHFIHSIFDIHSVGHATGFLTHHSAFGLSMVYALLLILPQISSQESKSRQLLMSVSCLLCLISVFLSFSRGAFVALLFSLGALFFFQRLNRTKIILVSALIFLIGSSIFLNPAIKDRLTNFDKSRFTDRLELLSFGWDEFKRRPFFGHGFGRFGIELQKYPDRLERANHHGHAHNIYLDLASGAGIFGLFSFLWFSFVLFRNLYRRAKEETQSAYFLSLLGIWCAFSIGGLFDEFLLWNQIIIPTMTLLGAVFEWKNQAGFFAPLDKLKATARP